MLARHLESFSKPLSTQDQANQAAGGPRNLYVLNLSLEMTTEELERLFSVFGEVVHVCIMAVLDQVGKRRAFVDMATGEAARQAISGLSGTYIHGYKIDVSFAIVQRSGGPVSGCLSLTAKAHSIHGQAFTWPRTSDSGLHRSQTIPRPRGNAFSRLHSI